MAKKNTTIEAPEAPIAPEADTAPVNLGVLTEQPTVNRNPVKVELADGTLRTDY